MSMLTDYHKQRKAMKKIIAALLIALFAVGCKT